jgi:hypothetical protein
MLVKQKTAQLNFFGAIALIGAAAIMWKGVIGIF